jgi:hypothetical protein
MGVLNMKRCNRILVSTLGVAMGLAVSGGAVAAQDCTTKIGAVLPTSVDWGRPIAETAQFVVDQVNEAGGVAGCNVEMVLRDSQVDPKIGVVRCFNADPDIGYSARQCAANVVLFVFYCLHQTG